MELGERRRERKGKKPSKQSPVWKIRHLAAGRGGKNLGEIKGKKNLRKEKTKKKKKKENLDTGKQVIFHI